MCRSRRAQLGVCGKCALVFEAARDVKQVAEWLGNAARSFTLRTLDEGVGDAAFMDDILAAVPAGGPS